MDCKQFCSNPVNDPDSTFLLVVVEGEAASSSIVSRDEARNDDRVISAAYQAWGGTSAPRVLGAFFCGASLGQWLRVGPSIVLMRTDFQS